MWASEVRPSSSEKMVAEMMVNVMVDRSSGNIAG